MLLESVFSTTPPIDAEAVCDVVVNKHTFWFDCSSGRRVILMTSFLCWQERFKDSGWGECATGTGFEPVLHSVWRPTTDRTKTYAPRWRLWGAMRWLAVPEVYQPGQRQLSSETEEWMIPAEDLYSGLEVMIPRNADALWWRNRVTSRNPFCP